MKSTVVKVGTKFVVVVGAVAVVVVVVVVFVVFMVIGASVLCDEVVLFPKGNAVVGESSTGVNCLFVDLYNT